MKKLFVFISGLLTYPLMALPALATSHDSDPNSANPCKDNSANDISEAICSLTNNVSGTIRNIVVFFIVIAVVIALFYLLYGGVKWITSRGDKAEVESARNHIMAAIIGLIVVFLAIFILSILLTAFGLKFDNIAIPTITSN